MAKRDKIKREVLPIPDTPYTGLTTCTARDPDTSFPKFEPLRPPEGVLKYCYNLLGHKTWFVESEGAIQAGAHQVRMEFAYDGSGIGKGGNGPGHGQIGESRGGQHGSRN